MSDTSMKKAIADLIREWFNATAGDKNRWSRDWIGVEIKCQLMASGNWKDRKRGNPMKGFRMGIGKGE